ncbi:hypothetical protein [Bacillus subtilis]|uniref:hypothetical protein n=1 Tax=Bacillus subtilis TaxID=1423 RepID=UPI001B9CE5A6|nr:hypothetical protein [Bacillus subtilis]CAF1802941.1 hypothetical protein NRS6141_00780 [Bacillus subtilis]CAF1877041.1 hypothetical protein NRS6204_00332 [Bacillus subtilis]CAF1879055.1 hypothetical protein NRS6205_00332 [Bacillus subtilis]
MAETNANASASIHVLADETLGGIKREYVEVDRKAEVGEKIVSIFGNCPYYSEKEYGKVIDVDIDDAEVEFESKYEDESWYILHGGYRVLEPTDIVHIDGQRYELTDRKAEVGEKVIVVDDDDSSEEFGSFRIGEVGTVESYSSDDMCYGLYANVRVSGERDIPLYLHEYRVLVPVEADEPQPADLIDVVSNLATRVADLERTIKRQKDEIDTLHKDNRTLGEELARLKELKGSNESWPAAVSFAEFCENYIAYSKAMKEAQS